jgi:soluble lytic murein transglycosylase-like protein
MAGPSARRRRVIAGAAAAAVLIPALWIARSPSLRASIHAGYAAFRDPALVRAPDAPEDASARPHEELPAPPVAEIELDQPEIAGDFDPVTDAALADPDAGPDAAASLTLPDLGFPVSQRTMRFVAYFAAGDKGRQAFVERFRRAGRYREHIEQALRDAEMPEDLLWLVAIESGFNPQAMSPKGAAGLFQFMPETGAKYGLAQTEMIDERRSVTKSTAAGVAHLKDLFAIYKQWDLALAAYNFGHEPLDEAIEKLKARRGPKDKDKPVDIKALAEARLIPKETANFVPQIQAFAIVAANRGRFGLDELDLAAPFDFGEIAVPAGTPLKTVAKAAGVSIAVMRDYNPDLLRDVVPSAGGDALVAVPADRVARVLAAFPVLQAREGATANATATATATATANAMATANANASATAIAKAGEARRKVLEKVPYGSSWLSVGEHLFPAGHPLAGAVLTAPVLPLLSVAIADRVDWAVGQGAIEAHAGEERVKLTLPVPSMRVVFAWIGPGAGNGGGAAMKLAMLSLGHHEFGRASRVLIQERHVAAHFRGLLDMGERASVAAFEVVPSVQYDVAAVERELDKVLGDYADKGPTGPELIAAKQQLKSRLDAERGRAGGGGETKAEALARIQRTAEKAEAVTAEELRALVKEVMAADKRVIVTSVPRG